MALQPALSVGSAGSTAMSTATGRAERMKVSTPWCRATAAVQVRVADGKFEFARYEAPPEGAENVPPSLPLMADVPKEAAFPSALRGEVAQVAAAYSEWSDHAARAKAKAQTAREIMATMASTADYFLSKWEELTEEINTQKDEARLKDAQDKIEKLRDRLAAQEQDEEMLRKEAVRDKAEGERLSREMRHATRSLNKNLLRALRRKARRLDASQRSIRTGKSRSSRSPGSSQRLHPATASATPATDIGHLFLDDMHSNPMLLSPASDNISPALTPAALGEDECGSDGNGTAQSMFSIVGLVPPGEASAPPLSPTGEIVGPSRGSGTQSSGGAVTVQASVPSQGIGSGPTGRATRPATEEDASSHSSTWSHASHATTNYTMTTVQSTKSSRTRRQSKMSKSGMSKSGTGGVSSGKSPTPASTRRPTEVIDATPEDDADDTESSDAVEDEAGVFGSLFMNMRGVWPARRAPHVPPKRGTFDPFVHERLGQTPCFKRGRFANPKTPFYHHLLQPRRPSAQGPLVIDASGEAVIDESVQTGEAIEEPAVPSKVSPPRAEITWRGAYPAMLPAAEQASSDDTALSAGRCPDAAPSEQAAPTTASVSLASTPRALGEKALPTSPALPSVPRPPSMGSLKAAVRPVFQERAAHRPFSAGTYAARPFSAGSLRSNGADTLFSLSTAESGLGMSPSVGVQRVPSATATSTPPRTRHKNLWLGIDSAGAHAIGGNHLKSSPTPTAVTPTAATLSPMTSADDSSSTVDESDDSSFTWASSLHSSEFPPPSTAAAAPHALTQPPLELAVGRRRSAYDPRPLPQFQENLKTSLREVISDVGAAPASGQNRASVESPTTTCWRELRVLRNLQKSPSPTLKAIVQKDTATPMPTPPFLARGVSPFALSPPPDATFIGHSAPTPVQLGSPHARPDKGGASDVVGWGYASPRAPSPQRLPLHAYPAVLTAGRQRLRDGAAADGDGVGDGASATPPRRIVVHVPDGQRQPVGKEPAAAPPVSNDPRPPSPPRARMRYCFRTAPDSAVQQAAGDLALRQACGMDDAAVAPCDDVKASSLRSAKWSSEGLNTKPSSGTRMSKSLAMSSSVSGWQAPSRTTSRTSHQQPPAAARRKPHCPCITVLDRAKRGTGLFPRSGAAPKTGRAARRPVQYLNRPPQPAPPSPPAPTLVSPSTTSTMPPLADTTPSPEARPTASPRRPPSGALRTGRAAPLPTPGAPSPPALAPKVLNQRCAAAIPAGSAAWDGFQAPWTRRQPRANTLTVVLT